jgi:hypothetical protein
MALDFLDPVTLFFVIGLVGGILKGDLRLPDAVYQLISIYLLVAIGLKGGVELAGAAPGDVVWPALATIGLGITIPLLAYRILRSLGRFGVPDSAAIAAHYGSVSAVTFAVILAYLDARGEMYEGFVAVLLVLLEIPAIMVGVLLARAFAPGASRLQFGKLAHEILLNRSIYLLVGGLAVGYFTGPEKISGLKPVFIDAFKGVLAFFLLEMGVVTAKRLGDLRKVGPFLIGFAIVMPLISGALGAWAGWAAGLSVGGTAVLAGMSASASYIAAPAAMRIAVPEANPTYYLVAALGITFPFNLIFGIRAYDWMARSVHLGNLAPW